jgi:antitoxin component YwqK of YwqJK toxin-antitoxin module
MNPKKYPPALCAILLFISFSFTAIAQQNNPLINSGELLKKGQDLHDNSKYKEAITTYSQINRSDTNYSDALYELSMSCYADSQMQKALDYAKEGLRLFPQDFTRFSMQAANALDDMNKSDEALAVYDAAIAKDPQSYILYFNKGITLYRLKKEEDAKPLFQQSLLINPYNASPHYFMGNIYLHQGNLVAALLAYKTYLLVAPKGKYVSNIISQLGKIATVSDEVLEYVKNKKNTGEDNFDFTQQILQSKMALDKKYKLLADMEDNIVRQIQVVDEKLEYKKNDKGFAMQFYAPMYIKFFQEENFEPMIFTIFSGLTLDKVESWNKKHKKDAEAFADKAREYLNEIKFTRTLQQTDRKTAKTLYLYENGKYLGKGPYNSREKLSLEGSWEFFYENGQVRSKGAFNAEEKKIGEWNYFYDNGTLKEKMNFKDDKQEGLAEGWYTNGNKWYTETYKDGQLNGLQTLYYYNSNLKQLNNYKDDKLNGSRKSFNSQGSLVSQTTFKDDKQDGLTIFYYPSGAKEDEVMYTNSKAQGKYKSFYESGKLKSEGNFTDDLKQGLWVTYYENGTPQEKINYLDNEITGEFTEYHENGKLSRKGNYTKKKIDGKLEEYDDDGKLYSDAVYEKGRLKEINSYDKTGKVVYNTGTRKGAANISFFTPEGIKTSEGYFNRDGNKDGKFSEYFLSGKISEETNYKDGVQDGPHTSYYFNGQKKVENNYVDGKENGYTKSHYFNGKLSYEGWIIDDQRQQNIIYYNQQGDISTKEFYLNDDLDGYTEYYYPGNIPDFDYKYHSGWLQEITQYDSTGKVLYNNVLKMGNGPMIFKHYSGKNMVEGMYKNYMLDGIYKLFYFDGSPRSVNYYKNDKRDSTYKEYFYGGATKVEGKYKSGAKVGSWKYYYNNGKISDEEIYTNGKLNGVDKIYNEDGTFDKLVNYKDGNIDGEYKIYGENNQLAVVLNFKSGYVKSYSYEDKSGNLVPPIPLTGSNGKVKSFYKTGSPAVDMSFTDNDVQGPCKFFYSNGKPYIDGKREYGYYDGLKKVYYPNGNVWTEENFVLGNLHGIRKTYYPNGKLEKEENFYNDEFHGTCKYYDEQGKLKQTRVYYYDNLIRVF